MLYIASLSQFKLFNNPRTFIQICSFYTFTIILEDLLNPVSSFFRSKINNISIGNNNHEFKIWDQYFTYIQEAEVVRRNKQKQKHTSFISYQLQYIEKQDHPTWMTISKFKNNVFNYRRLAATAKTIPIFFVCSSITITYIYNTFSQVYILPIVARRSEQTHFEIILNIKGYRTH